MNDRNTGIDNSNDQYSGVETADDQAAAVEGVGSQETETDGVTEPDIEIDGDEIDSLDDLEGEANGAEADDEIAGISDLNDLDFVRFKVDTDVQIDPGAVVYWELDDLVGPSDDALELEYEVIVRTGPRINVLVMDHDELAPFLNYENAIYDERVSDRNTKFSTTESEIPFGDYAFVLENPDSARTARVDVELTVR